MKQLLQVQHVLQRCWISQPPIRAYEGVSGGDCNQPQQRGRWLLFCKRTRGR